MILLGIVAAFALQADPAMIRRIFEEALTRNRKEFGTEDPRTAQAARDLGLFLIREHDTPAARAALTEAVEMEGQLADVAELASVSPPEQAAALWSRAAKSTDRALAAKSLAALGELREAAGDRAGAADFYRQSLVKRETAARLVALALVIEPQKALPLLQRALAINRKQYGARHPETAAVETNLVGPLLAARRIDEAVAMGRRALAAFEATVGEEHPRTAAAASNFAEALHAKGDLKQAEQLYRRAWAIDLQAYGSAHPETLADIKNLAEFLQETGRAKEAEALLNAARE